MWIRDGFISLVEDCVPDSTLSANLLSREAPITGALVSPLEAESGTTDNTEHTLGTISTDAGQYQLVPALVNQYLFLSSSMAVSSASLCSRVRLRGEFNLIAVKQVWGRLMECHPMLRSYFHSPASATKISDFSLRVLDKVVPPEPAVRDLKAIQAAQQNALLDAEEICWKSNTWDFRCWPLHRFQVFILSEDTFEVFFVNTHLISDGISNQIIIKEFVANYTLLMQQKSLPPTPYS